MKKASKICCLHCDTNDEQPPPPSAPPLEHSLKTSSQQPRLPKEEFCVVKRENAFVVPKAHFSPGGDSHRVVIRFDGEGGAQMKLSIDGDEMLNLAVNATAKLRGNADVSIDGMVVDFVWDLTQIPKFSFFTRKISTHGSIAGGGGSGGDGGGGSGGDGGGGGGHRLKSWTDHEHVYRMHILGI